MTSNHYNPSDPNLIYLQSRAETDPALIEEYAEAMAAGAQFPALKAIGEQHILYIYDGYHRGQAAQKTGLPLYISVKPGTKAEAEWLALAANQYHGLRRSNADKQKIVRLALAHEFGAKLSDRQLAEHCGVSHPTVAKIREEMEATGKIYQSATRLGADGREINVGNIGGQPAEYVAIWQLEQALKEWMDRNYPYGLQTQIDALESIKQKTIVGLGMLETLTTKDILPCPRRKSDVVQACNNVLSQLQQKIGLGPVPAQPAPTEDSAAELREQLSRALNADSDRWTKPRQAGLSNAELMEAIGRAFGIEGGASGGSGGGYYCKGLKNPRFWLGFRNYSSRPPTLAGAALRDAVRELLDIPFPGEATELAEAQEFGPATQSLAAYAAAEAYPKPDSWSPSTPGLAANLTYRQQRVCIRFAALVEKIKDIARMDELDRRLAELEAEIAGDPAKASEGTR